MIRTHDLQIHTLWSIILSIICLEKKRKKNLGWFYVSQKYVTIRGCPIPPFTLHLISNVSGDVCWKKSKRYVNIDRLTLHNQNVKLKQALIDRKNSSLQNVNWIVSLCDVSTLKSKKEKNTLVFYSLQWVLISCMLFQIFGKPKT